MVSLVFLLDTWPSDFFVVVTSWLRVPWYSSQLQKSQRQKLETAGHIVSVAKSREK